VKIEDLILIHQHKGFYRTSAYPSNWHMPVQDFYLQARYHSWYSKTC